MIRLENASKRFQGGGYALKGICLDIKEGEFVAVTGPAGSGKTTLLKLIAGLEEPDEGRILIDGKDMNGVKPADRGIALAGHNYRLYPHMDIYDNMAFGIMNGQYSKEETDRRVLNAAEVLGLRDSLRKMPEEISELESYKTVMGRALVREPRIILMDKPLRAASDDLRDDVKAVLLELYHALPLTMVYATDDMDMAMSLGTKIVIMRDGIVIQEDTPDNIRKHPEDSFVKDHLSGALDMGDEE